MVDLTSLNLSPEEFEKRKAQLLKRQKKEVEYDTLVEELRFLSEVVYFLLWSMTFSLSGQTD